MTLVSLIVLSLCTIVFGHDCRKYNLSSTDQSLIDMMQHFLHTFRSKECPSTVNSQIPLQNIGVTYVRWGRKTCPKGTELVYSGQAGGSSYNQKGGGVNNLCLPNDPDDSENNSVSGTNLRGSKYRIGHGNTKPSAYSDAINNKEVPCALCRRKQKSAMIMIPGRKHCYKGWKMEYNGYLLTEHDTLVRPGEFACMDKNPEVLDKPFGSLDGPLFYAMRMSCGSLKCPPYKDKTDVLCVVCTK